MKTYKTRVRLLVRVFPYVVVGHGLLLASVSCCGLVVLMVVVVVMVVVVGGISYIDSNKKIDYRKIKTYLRSNDVSHPLSPCRDSLAAVGPCRPALGVRGLRWVFVAHVSCRELVVLVVVVVV